MKPFTIFSQGEGKVRRRFKSFDDQRIVTARYSIQEEPWTTTYRLELPKGSTTASLQAYATIENSQVISIQTYC